ncbi:MAG TPA: S8 family serine peptidase, partial [Pirellulales bacterium]
MSYVMSELPALWAETRGDRRICIAVLDAPIDLHNPSLADAAIEQIFRSRDSVHKPCGISHGTEVASVIFGRHDGSVQGISPECRGVSIPIFDCWPDGQPSARQADLAHAIRVALAAGVQIINVSAGQLVPHLDAERELFEAVRECVARRVLVVAAAGNDGCDCLHVPAALPSVLTVGAMNSHGQALEESNWGSAYQRQGILAPGENVLVVSPDGNSIPKNGTSYATAIVSGVAGLLLSRQLQRGRQADPLQIREALLKTAIGCDKLAGEDCRRLLAGRLNVLGAIAYLDHWSNTKMDESNDFIETRATEALAEPKFFPSIGVNATEPLEGRYAGRVVPDGRKSVDSSQSAAIQPAACSACRGERELVYALGQLGHDFGTEACLDAFKQRMRLL